MSQQTTFLSDAIEATKQINLVDMIGTLTTLKKVSAREYAGPCMRCGGHDRFRVNLDRGWFCRRCTGSDHWHDAIDLRTWLYGETVTQAIQHLIGRRPINKEELAKIAQQREEAECLQRTEEAEKQRQVREQLTKVAPWKTYHNNLDEYPGIRSLWSERGIPEDWQNYYHLGYSPSRRFMHGETPFDCPSLTIPYLRAHAGNKQLDCVGLQHRLLRPPYPNDKYRPHVAGAGKSLYLPWYESPTLENDCLIVEGEIKAMVTFINLWQGEDVIVPNLSVVGTAGAQMKDQLKISFKDCKRIWICLDPDANREADYLANDLGKERCKVIKLPAKIDDLFLAGALDGWKLLELMGY